MYPLKVLDRIVSNQLWWFVSPCKLLNNYQYGIKKGELTTDNLFYMLYRIADTLFFREHTIFYKAFDRIDIYSVLYQMLERKLAKD